MFFGIKTKNRKTKNSIVHTLFYAQMNIFSLVSLAYTHHQYIQYMDDSWARLSQNNIIYQKFYAKVEVNAIGRTEFYSLQLWSWLIYITRSLKHMARFIQ